MFEWEPPAPADDVFVACAADMLPVIVQSAASCALTAASVDRVAAVDVVPVYLFT